MLDQEQKIAYGIDTLHKRSGVGRTTIFDQIAKGHLKARKLGRRTIILKDDAEAWLASLPAVQPRANKGAY